MKKAIIILLLLLTLTVTAKDYKIGYLIVVSEGSKNVVTRTQDISVAESLLKEKFPNINVDLKYELTYSRYIEVENEETAFYIEVKVVNKNGKYRRVKNKHL